MGFLNRYAYMLYSVIRSRCCTFVADVEACVVVGLISDELDPYSWTFTDHSLKWYLSTPTRVKQHHRASIQTAPQHQPAGREGVGLGKCVCLCFVCACVYR